MKRHNFSKVARRGYYAVNAPDCQGFVHNGFHMVTCAGAAHANAMIDHCMQCLGCPCGFVAIPVFFTDVAAMRAASEFSYNLPDLDDGQQCQAPDGAIWIRYGLEFKVCPLGWIGDFVTEHRWVGRAEALNAVAVTP